MLGQVDNSGAEAVTWVEHVDESMVDRPAPVWVECRRWDRSDGCFIQGCEGRGRV